MLPLITVIHDGGVTYFLFHYASFTYLKIMLSHTKDYYIFLLIFMIIRKQGTCLSIVTLNRFIIEATADNTLEYSAALQAPPSMSKSRAK